MIGDEQLIKDLRGIIKEKDQEIEKLKQDLMHYAINVCPDKDREIQTLWVEITRLENRNRELTTDYSYETTKKNMEIAELNAEIAQMKKTAWDNRCILDD